MQSSIIELQSQGTLGELLVKETPFEPFAFHYIPEDVAGPLANQDELIISNLSISWGGTATVEIPKTNTLLSGITIEFLLPPVASIDGSTNVYYNWCSSIAYALIADIGFYIGDVLIENFDGTAALVKQQLNTNDISSFIDESGGINPQPAISIGQKIVRANIPFWFNDEWSQAFSLMSSSENCSIRIRLRNLFDVLNTAEVGENINQPNLSKLPFVQPVECNVWASNIYLPFHYGANNLVTNPRYLITQMLVSDGNGLHKSYCMTPDFQPKTIENAPSCAVEVPWAVEETQGHGVAHGFNPYLPSTPSGENGSNIHGPTKFVIIPMVGVIQTSGGDKVQSSIALTTLQTNNLVPFIIYVHDVLVAPGYVIGTAPSVCSKVPILTSVAVFVSIGDGSDDGDDRIGNVFVPNLMGNGNISISQASTLLSHSGLRTGDISYMTNTVNDQWTILQSHPSSGSNVKVGSSVDLVLSNGSADVAVPSVIGDTETVGLGKLSAFTVIKHYVTMPNTSTQVSGTIIGQNPPSTGLAQLPSGATVEITISQGKIVSAVVDVTGNNETDAISNLTSATSLPGSLAIPSSDVVVVNTALEGVIHFPNNVTKTGAGLVLKQDPPGVANVKTAGYEALCLPEGEKVNISLATGVLSAGSSTNLRVVPNVLNMDLENAQTLLYANELGIGTVWDVIPMGSSLLAEFTAGTKKYNTIAGQSPLAPDSTICTGLIKGSTVNVAVWRKGFAMPNMVGVKYKDAIATLYSDPYNIPKSNIKYHFVNTATGGGTSVDVFDVVSQSPADGTVFNTGKNFDVVLTVYIGTSIVTMPDLTGTILDTSSWTTGTLDKLRVAGFDEETWQPSWIKTYTVSYQAGKKTDEVVSQWPLPGTLITKNHDKTPVEITYMPLQVLFDAPNYVGPGAQLTTLQEYIATVRDPLAPTDTSKFAFYLTLEPISICSGQQTQDGTIKWAEYSNNTYYENQTHFIVQYFSAKGSSQTSEMFFTVPQTLDISVTWQGHNNAVPANNGTVGWNRTTAYFPARTNMTPSNLTETIIECISSVPSREAGVYIEGNVLYEVESGKMKWNINSRGLKGYARAVVAADGTGMDTYWSDSKNYNTANYDIVPLDIWVGALKVARHYWVKYPDIGLNAKRGLQAKLSVPQTEIDADNDSFLPSYVNGQPASSMVIPNHSSTVPMKAIYDNTSVPVEPFEPFIMFEKAGYNMKNGGLGKVNACQIYLKPVNGSEMQKFLESLMPTNAMSEYIVGTSSVVGMTKEFSLMNSVLKQYWSKVQPSVTNFSQLVVAKSHFQALLQPVDKSWTILLEAKVDNGHGMDNIFPMDQLPEIIATAFRNIRYLYRGKYGISRDPPVLLHVNPFWHESWASVSKPTSGGIYTNPTITWNIGSPLISFNNSATSKWASGIGISQNNGSGYPQMTELNFVYNGKTVVGPYINTKSASMEDVSLSFVAKGNDGQFTTFTQINSGTQLLGGAGWLSRACNFNGALSITPVSEFAKKILGNDTILSEFVSGTEPKIQFVAKNNVPYLSRTSAESECNSFLSAQTPPNIFPLFDAQPIIDAMPKMTMPRIPSVASTTFPVLEFNVVNGSYVPASVMDIVTNTVALSEAANGSTLPSGAYGTIEIGMDHTKWSSLPFTPSTADPGIWMYIHGLRLCESYTSGSVLDRQKRALSKSFSFVASTGYENMQILSYNDFIIQLATGLNNVFKAQMEDCLLSQDFGGGKRYQLFYKSSSEGDTYSTSGGTVDWWRGVIQSFSDSNPWTEATAFDYNATGTKWLPISQTYYSPGLLGSSTLVPNHGISPYQGRAEENMNGPINVDMTGVNSYYPGKVATPYYLGSWEGLYSNSSFTNYCLQFQSIPALDSLDYTPSGTVPLHQQWLQDLLVPFSSVTMDSSVIAYGNDLTKWLAKFPVPSQCLRAMIAYYFAFAKPNSQSGQVSWGLGYGYSDGIVPRNAKPFTFVKGGLGKADPSATEAQLDAMHAEPGQSNGNNLGDVSISIFQPMSIWVPFNDGGSLQTFAVYVQVMTNNNTYGTYYIGGSPFDCGAIDKASRVGTAPSNLPTNHPRGLSLKNIVPFNDNLAGHTVDVVANYWMQNGPIMFHYSGERSGIGERHVSSSITPSTSNKFALTLGNMPGFSCAIQSFGDQLDWTNVSRKTSSANGDGEDQWILTMVCRDYKTYPQGGKSSTPPSGTPSQECVITNSLSSNIKAGLSAYGLAFCMSHSPGIGVSKDNELTLLCANATYPTTKRSGSKLWYKNTGLSVVRKGADLYDASVGGWAKNKTSLNWLPSSEMFKGDDFSLVGNTQKNMSLPAAAVKRQIWMASARGCSGGTGAIEGWVGLNSSTYEEELVVQSNSNVVALRKVTNSTLISLLDSMSLKVGGKVGYMGMAFQKATSGGLSGWYVGNLFDYETMRTDLGAGNLPYVVLNAGEASSLSDSVTNNYGYPQLVRQFYTHEDTKGTSPLTASTSASYTFNAENGPSSTELSSVVIKVTANGSNDWKWSKKFKNLYVTNYRMFGSFLSGIEGLLCASVIPSLTPIEQPPPAITSSVFINHQTSSQTLRTEKGLGTLSGSNPIASDIDKAFRYGMASGYGRITCGNTSIPHISANPVMTLYNSNLTGDGQPLHARTISLKPVDNGSGKDAPKQPPILKELESAWLHAPSIPISGDGSPWIPAKFRVNIPFRRPVVELIWYCTSAGTRSPCQLWAPLTSNWVFNDFIRVANGSGINPILSARLFIDDIAITDVLPSYMYDTKFVQYNHIGMDENHGINLFSFSVDPSSWLPLGHFDLTKTTNSYLEIVINPAVISTTENLNLHIIARCFNVLNMKGGYPRLAIM